jgi:DNA-binding CsgD family transcriptional regulator/signal transduction histidine kinase
VSDDVTPQISAALAGAVPHRAVAVLAGACARSPMLVHGEAGIASRIKTGELAQLAATVPVGEAWQGSAPIAGERRPVVAAAAVAAGTGSLLVLVRDSEAPLGESALSLVSNVWAIVAAALDQRLEDAEPTDLAASRHAASERARVAADLSGAHAATLSALLGTLRARDLDDGAARRAAIDLAAAALVALRAAGERERELTDEPVEQAFALLRDELRPLVRYGSTEIELAGPEDGRSLPSPVAQAARAIVRGAVLTMLEQAGVSRIRVGWELGEDLRVSVRDDGPGELAPQGLAVHGLADRARALDGELEVDSVPGWGTHVQARLPLGPAQAAPPAGKLAALNPREREVLEHLARGRRNRQIAEELQISENTVKFHVANVLSKLGAGSRGEAGAIARDAGLGAPGAQPTPAARAASTIA